ncbi:MAG: ATP-binding protein, partial [Nanoarchaeota archaeon]
MEKHHVEEWNSWWFTGNVPKELLHEYKRHLYVQLQNSIPKRYVISLTGLRRTGKTTLLFQLIEQLLTAGVKKTNILYFSFDDTPNSIESLLDLYRALQKKDFRKEKIYVFLDEIQKADNWSNQLKKYYDLYPQMKFIISGSEALFIGNSVKETLAGRLQTFLLKPLSVKEFLEIQKLNVQQSSAELQILFLRYIENGGFPELVGKQQAEIKEYVRSIVLDKIIFKDLVTLFSIRDTETIKQLVELIAANPGIYVDYASLSRQLDKDRRSIKNYIFLLQESFLIILLGN